MLKTLALLRGVNVGGHTVKMERLRELFEQMGCTGVSTHIQSGNVLFDATGEQEGILANRLSTGLQAALGFEVPVMVLSAQELAGILDANPFARRELAEGERLYVTVLERNPSAEVVAGLTADPRSTDEFAVAGRAAWVLCRGGYHKTAYSNGFFEKKLKMRATTRNLEVMEKLLELARA